VLSCADSRVPPELIFDQGLGDLFTVRVAGNIVDYAILGSLEYAAAHLHVPIIIVLGHYRLRRGKATIEGGEPNTHIEALAKAIRPAVGTGHRNESGALMENAVRDNVRIRGEAARAIEPNSGRTRTPREGCRFEELCTYLDTGAVEFLKGD
jgi:carbonic anhydrase